MTNAAPKCHICGEPLTPRGGVMPRFCPRCGRRLPVAHRSDSRVISSNSQTATPAVLSLILGILALPVPFGCIPFGVPAILLGLHARNKIDESRGALRGHGLAGAGVILGCISVGLWILLVCGGIL